MSTKQTAAHSELLMLVEDEGEFHFYASVGSLEDADEDFDNSVKFVARSYIVLDYATGKVFSVPDGEPRRVHFTTTQKDAFYRQALIDKTKFSWLARKILLSVPLVTLSWRRHRLCTHSWLNLLFDFRVGSSTFSFVVLGRYVQRMGFHRLGDDERVSGGS
jgi:hypothetical protein